MARGRWQPGESGNPNGRPRDPGLRGQIRIRTKDGKALLDFVLAVFGNRKAPTALRLEAAKWLADRGWGRPAQALEHSGPEGQDLEIVLKWTDAA